MKHYVRSLIRLIFGLFLYALGLFFTIQANIGLAPWEAFSIGVSYLTQLSYGDIVVITGLVIVVLDFALHEKVGLGTILNAILVGKFVDLIQLTNLLPTMTNSISGVLMLLLGQAIICVGSYFYIGAGLGCGPRDTLMVALGKRMPRLPIGVVRGLLEGIVLIVGWLLGAKVGIGTAIYVLGIGFVFQLTCKLLHFDVKNIEHESIVATVKAFLPLRD